MINSDCRNLHQIFGQSLYVGVTVEHKHITVFQASGDVPQVLLAVNYGNKLALNCTTLTVVHLPGDVLTHAPYERHVVAHLVSIVAPIFHKFLVADA